MSILPNPLHRNHAPWGLRSPSLTYKPFFGWWGGVGAVSVEREELMAGWEQMEQGLSAREYARRVCQELGWPYRDNLTLLSECIESFACLKGLDVWGGFSGIMVAVEYAKRTGILKERGRWFFTDGDYAKFTPEELAPPKKVEPLDEIDLEIPALGRVFHQNRKPN